MTPKKPKPKAEKSIEEIFDQMTQEFITDMERVNCAPTDFLAGIRAAAHSLQDRASSYAQEIGSKGNDE